MILNMTDELLRCENLDELCRRAVELPREYFGFRRTGLYLLDPASGKFRSTFGTGMDGKTRDERGCSVEKDFFSSQLNLLRDARPRWHVENGVDIGHFEQGKFRKVGQGWVVATPIYLGPTVQGCFFNDEGGLDTPFDPARQEILALYCHSLGSLIREKQADEALRASQRQYLQLFDESPEAMIVYSLQTQAILAANLAAQKQYGYSAAEFLLLRWSDLEWNEWEQAAQEKDSPLHRRHDGRIFSTALRKHDIIFENQKARLVLAVDISARIEAEQAMERLANFARYNPNPVIEFSRSGEILYQNDAVRDMLGLFGEMKLPDILPPDYPRIIGECLGEQKAVLRREIIIAGHTLSWSFFPIAEIGVVHCYGGNITDKILLEDQLRQAQKMESVGQLAGGIAHDFNNILTAVLGYIEYLQDLRELSDEGMTACREMEASVRRAADLTKQLLLYSRKKVGARAVFDLNDALREVQSMLGRLIGEQIRLTCKTSRDPLPISGDPSMVAQVLTNLVVNARDAMRSGGTLVLETGAVTKEIHAGKPRQWVYLKVKDTGEGMDEATKQRIFEPFFSTKLPGQGTGLGLSTVYAIVRQHEGSIDVKSAPGKGSTFTVYLPRSSGEGGSVAAPVAPRKESGTLRPARVLMVEDEALVRKLARRMLVALGMEVIEADHGPKALEIWQKRKDEIDVLFTDMVMPGGLSGKALALQLLKEKSSLKVILTSGYSFEPDNVLPEGTLYLPKPYSMQDLTNILAQALAK